MSRDRTILAEPGTGGTHRRDIVIVVLLTVLAALIGASLEINERIFAGTRRWEHLQIDELPAVLVVLSASLAWFAWRRYREAVSEIARRRAAEAHLAATLLENRRLARQFMQLQEAERKRLAREMHDELGQYLNAIKMDAVAIQRRSAQQDVSSSIPRAAASIVEHTDHLHAIVRDLIGQLRPTGLDELGLRAALEHFLENWRSRLPEIRLDVRLEGDLDGLGEQLDLTIYRLLQEGLTNVARHSGAQRVDLRVVRDTTDALERDAIVVEISDDGRGADPAARGRGVGLIGMRERVEALGGRFHIESRPGQGFTVRAIVPVCTDTQTAAQ